MNGSIHTKLGTVSLTSKIILSMFYFLLWQYREAKITLPHTIFGLWFATSIGVRSFYPHSYIIFPLLAACSWCPLFEKKKKTVAMKDIAVIRCKKRKKNLTGCTLWDTQGEPRVPVWVLPRTIKQLLLYCEITLTAVFIFWSLCPLSHFVGLNII